jgi:predicted DNA-binding WGR domain protein
MIYPVQIEKNWFDHRGGTKSYQIIGVFAQTGRALAIWRWGKTGHENQIQVFQFEDHKSARVALSRKANDRLKSGYEYRSNMAIDAASDVNLMAMKIGVSVFNRLGAHNVTWIDPSAPVASVKEPDPIPVWAKDPLRPGKFININEPKPRLIKEPPVKDPTLEERIAADPMWGLI